MKAIVVINEQHSLFPQQEELLKATFDEWSMRRIPKKGMTLEERIALAKELVGTGAPSVLVFASPEPVMLGICVASYALIADAPGVLVFTNDRREKKEFPNGVVRSIVAETGWKLVWAHNGRVFAK